jgi:hypothetical protein
MSERRLRVPCWGVAVVYGKIFSMESKSLEETSHLF